MLMYIHVDLFVVLVMLIFPIAASSFTILSSAPLQVPRGHYSDWGYTGEQSPEHCQEVWCRRIQHNITTLPRGRRPHSYVLDQCLCITV